MWSGGRTAAHTPPATSSISTLRTRGAAHSHESLLLLLLLLPLPLPQRLCTVLTNTHRTCSRGGVRHPIISTVLYLTPGGLGGPTLVTDQTLKKEQLATKGW